MKKFVKSFVLCLVVAACAVCGLAGCGKKKVEENQQLEPVSDDVVEVISAEELFDYFEKENVFLEFVDGFSLQVDMRELDGGQHFNLTASVLMYYDRLDMQIKMEADVKSKFDIAVDMIWKNSDDGNWENDHIYIDFDFGSKGYVTSGASEVDLNLIDADEIFTNTVAALKDLPTINTYPSRALYLAFDSVDEVVVEKTTFEDGQIEYKLNVGDQYYVYGFNKFHELAKFYASTEAVVEGEQVKVEVRMIELGHDERISYPSNIEEYQNITAK